MSSSSPECYYCKCSERNALVQCLTTKQFLCNGKGDVKESHIVHFLKETNNSRVKFLANEKLDVTCFKCKKETNVFKLGLSQVGNEKFFCCFKCHQDFYLNHDFMKIIENDAFIVVDIPNNYSKITVTDARNKIIRVTNRQKEDKHKIELRHFFKYSNSSKFYNTMSKFIDAEVEAINENCKLLYYPENSYYRQTKIRTRQLEVDFQEIYKLVSLGSILKTKVSGLDEPLNVRVVSKLSNGRLILLFDEDFDDSLDIQYFQITPNTIVPKYQKNALSIFCGKSSKIDHTLREFILGDYNEEKNKIRKYKINQPDKNLNEYQVEAIETAMSNRLSIIQGPPGTGKTHTVAYLVNEIIKNNSKQNKKSKILCVSASNASADNIALRILEKFGDIGICRVFGSSYETTTEKLEKIDSSKLANKQNKDEDDIIANSNVVVSTLASTGNYKKFSKCSFTYMIVDEAGQCIDIDLLIPLQYKVEQLVLIGDFQQLGPIVNSNAGKIGKFDTPLMERIKNNGAKIKVLGLQYRMHPELISFPNKEFYGSKLKSGVSSADRSGIDLSFLPNPNVPLLFWNVNSQEELINKSSYQNQEEAGCVFALIEFLYKRGVSSTQIGIISPYNAQQEFIRHNMKYKCKAIKNEDFFNDIEISSIDAFQGREKNFIILSIVRSNSKGDTGFLKDAKRINVSLTRAKNGLFIVGHGDTIGAYDIWKKLIEHCKERNVFVEMVDGQWRPSSFNPRSQN